MIKHQRQQRIQQLVEADGSVTVVDLASQFQVSDMTIRRDLQDLEVRGLVRRIHGGAITPDRPRSPIEPPMLRRINGQALAKRRIAQAAASMVQAGETIFIGSGTTTLAVAEALRNHGSLTVVTNALTVANTLAVVREITVVVVGGFLRRSELSLIGHFAEAMLRDLRIDKVIIGMRGIDPDHGLTSDHLQELMTDRAIISISDTVIVVADHTKFGRVAASPTAPVTAATVVITDTHAPPEIVAAIRTQGVGSNPGLKGQDMTLTRFFFLGSGPLFGLANEAMLR